MADEPATLDLDAPEVQEAIKAQVEEQTKTLRRTNATLLDEKKKLQALKDSLGDDFDPEEYQALRDAHKKAEEDKATKAGEWDKLKGQLVEEHQKALGAKDGEIGTLRDALISEKRDAAITRSLAKANATDEGLELLPLRLQDLVRVEKDGDRYVRRIYLPGADAPKMKADGEYWDTDDLMGWAQEKYPGSFKGTGSSGGGAPPQGGGRGRGGVVQITREQARDPKAYQAARKQADDSGTTLQIVEAA